MEKLGHRFDEPLNSELQRILKRVAAVKEGREGDPGPQGEPGIDAVTDTAVPDSYIHGLFEL